VGRWERGATRHAQAAERDGETAARRRGARTFPLALTLAPFSTRRSSTEGWLPLTA
jgi:hypothetical protein